LLLRSKGSLLLISSKEVLTVLKNVGEGHQIVAKEAHFSPIDSEEEMF
jgi:hypothetical protein